jgi:hypothetical protein
VTVRSKTISYRRISLEFKLRFSPLTQIKCVRYTTPMGHIWLTSVSGKAVESGQAIRTYGTGASKEDSRKRAIEEWLKKASLSDFQFMHLPKRPIPAESFQNLGATQDRLEDAAAALGKWSRCGLLESDAFSSDVRFNQKTHTRALFE